MTSRLSSLLVRDGIVTIKRMERAFQRQVMSGGGLDTVLLELGMVPESRLIEYVALASGLPPATAADVDAIDPAAAERCPPSIAERFAVVPLGFDGDALRVLVHDPVNLHTLEELADELVVPIQPFVALEYRFHEVAHRVFGVAVDPRFVALAEAQADAGPVAVGRSRTVVIESTPPPIADAEPARERVRSRTPVTSPGRPRAGEGSEPPPRPDPEVGEPSPAPMMSDRSAANVAAVLAAPSTLPVAAVDVTPLTLAAARAALATARHRDEVFEILLRGVRAHTFYAGLLTVQGRTAIGRLAIIGDEPDARGIGSVLIGLDVPSAFRKTVDGGSPYIGPVATGEAAVDEMIRRMGGVLPPTALVMPIALRGRVVALVYGHRGADVLSITEMSELLPLAGAAADAIGRIIRGKKAGAPEAPTPTAPPIVREPVQPPGVAATAAAILLRRVYGSDVDEREAAKREALERPAETLQALRGHFPGRLDTARTPDVRRPAAAYGPVLDLVVRLGEAAAPLVAAELQSADPDTRFYAAVCAAEIGARHFLPRLAACVFDADAGVQRIAIDELSRVPVSEVGRELLAIRQVLDGRDVERARRAAAVLGELGDAGAVPALLDLHTAGGPLSATAASALVRITKQDFRDSPKKWQKWWEKNQGRHRMEWMLEGLDHKDAEIRALSIADLHRLTGESFGYQANLGKREREAARQRWLLWWHETGRRRFRRLSGGIETERRSG